MGTSRLLIWSVIAFFGCGALSYFVTAIVRGWPAMRWVGYCCGVIVGTLLARALRAWLKRRAERRQQDLGLIFDPIRRLRR